MSVCTIPIPEEPINLDLCNTEVHVDRQFINLYINIYTYTGFGTTFFMVSNYCNADYKLHVDIRK